MVSLVWTGAVARFGRKRSGQGSASPGGGWPGRPPARLPRRRRPLADGRWQVFGLANGPAGIAGVPTVRRFPEGRSSACVAGFVFAYRCGAVPELRRIPSFGPYRSLPRGGRTPTQPECMKKATTRVNADAFCPDEQEFSGMGGCCVCYVQTGNRMATGNSLKMLKNYFNPIYPKKNQIIPAGHLAACKPRTCTVRTCSPIGEVQEGHCPSWPPEASSLLPPTCSPYPPP